MFLGRIINKSEKKRCTEVRVPATQAKKLNLFQNNSHGKLHASRFTCKIASANSQGNR